MVVILLLSPLSVNGTCDTQKPSSSPSCRRYHYQHHKNKTASAAPSSSAAAKAFKKLNNDVSFNRASANTKTNKTAASANYNTNNNKPNNNKNYVRHITRVNISDVYSQIECNDGDVEPITKEGKS